MIQSSTSLLTAAAIIGGALAALIEVFGYPDADDDNKAKGKADAAIADVALYIGELMGKIFYDTADCEICVG